MYIKTTQIKMAIISNICNKQLTGKIGTYTPINPNDDVNMSQSTNDSFNYHKR